MKSIIKKIAALVALAVLTLSFNVLGSDKVIKVSESKVTWKGYKVTGSHEGTIGIQSGSLSFDGDQLTGGSIIIDMTSINVTDLQGEYQKKLEGHLKSDDFFGVEAHTTAKIDFTAVKAISKNAYAVTANLTVKGKTNPVKFEISIYGNKATASLKIDRTKYGVKYGSANFFEGLKDKAIYDEFDIVADLVF